MSRTIKKILVAIILFIAVSLVKNTNSLAMVSNQEEAFNAFANKKFPSEYNLYLGEKIKPTDWSISWYLKPTIKIDDLKIAGIVNQDEIISKKIGSTNIAVTMTYNGKTVTKKFKINVKKTSESTKLDSKTNDVVTISQDSNAKNKILLANSELWNAKDKTYKLTTKSTGNVAKYVYSSVYENRGDLTDSTKITATLKKDNTLTVENSKGKLSASKVKDISDFGYLTNSGKFYFYDLDKNGKLKIIKRASGISNILSDYVLSGNGKTYAISGVKICDIEAVEADNISSCNSGLLLDKKGRLYYYYYDFGYTYNSETQKYTKVRKESYVVKKVASNVKKLVGNYQYQTKDGKTEKFDNNGEWVFDTSGNVTMWLYDNNILKLKSNNRLYLNDVLLINKVENIYSADGTQCESALIVRQDGSIWRLDLGGKAQLTKVRSGKDDNKRISKPTNLTATKFGKNNVKVKWSKVEGATKYTIYRSDSKNGKYKVIGTSKTNSYKDKGIEIGKAYYYKVVANYSESKYDSLKSSAVKIKIPKNIQSITVNKKSKTSFTVSYKKVSGVSGYEIEYSTNKDFKKSTIKNTTKTSVTIKELKKNKTYYVRVRAFNTINGANVYSGYSEVQKVTLK